MRTATILVLFAWLAACAAPISESRSAKYAQLSTTSLWTLQQSNPSLLELAFIEAELGVRGQSHFGRSYLGRRTSSALGVRLYARVNGENSDLNCNDFPSAAAAQKTFLSLGGPFHDPNNLDADGDGLACEWGVHLREVSAVRSRPVAPVRPRYSGARCYVGPRGGTYTLTASGNRNYSGC